MVKLNRSDPMNTACAYARTLSCPDTPKNVKGASITVCLLLGILYNVFHSHTQRARLKKHVSQ